MFHCARSVVRSSARALNEKTTSLRQNSSSSSDEFRLKQYGEKYFSGKKASFVSDLNMLDPQTITPIPIYRATTCEGEVLDQEALVDKELSVSMLQTMVKLAVMDRVLFDAQRQGRISFYMTSTGEEAIHIGSASGLETRDLVFVQYRETGVLMWRKFPLSQFMHSCYGNNGDWGKGKQMPIHYGSDEHNFVTISSPLTTQMPQAVGSAYAFKRQPNNDRVVCCYFGDGAASEGDAHAAFNFAATLAAPVIFFCRNNGYAISTPTSEQYAGDGIAGKAVGYGLHTIRVDGNDILAVRRAVVRARQLALENKPVLIEAMTYRLGHHSTSDDSTAYRTASEMEEWDRIDNPVARFARLLEARGWWSAEMQTQLESETRKEVLKAFGESEKLPNMPVTEMFNDVYRNSPSRLTRQKDELVAHLNSYGEHYPMEKFEK